MILLEVKRWNKNDSQWIKTPALRSSPPTNSSAAYSDALLSAICAKLYALVFGLKDILLFSFGISVFLMCVRFFRYLVCDAHSNFISADNLEYAVPRFILFHKTLRPCAGAYVLELILGMFLVVPFLPIGIGQYWVLDIFPRPIGPA